MKVSVSIPIILRSFTENQKKVEIYESFDLPTVEKLLEKLEDRFPGIKERLCEEGKVRSFINIYVNDDDIRFSDDLDTQICDGDSVMIIPAVAGGAWNG